jgi:hypothetical protein
VGVSMKVVNVASVENMKIKNANMKIATTTKKL